MEVRPNRLGHIPRNPYDNNNVCSTQLLHRRATSNYRPPFDGLSSACRRWRNPRGALANADSAAVTQSTSPSRHRVRFRRQSTLWDVCGQSILPPEQVYAGSPRRVIPAEDLATRSSDVLYRFPLSSSEQMAVIRVASSSEAWRWLSQDRINPSPRPSALTMPPGDARFSEGIGIIGLSAGCACPWLRPARGCGHGDP